MITRATAPETQPDESIDDPRVNEQPELASDGNRSKSRITLTLSPLRSCSGNFQTPVYGYCSGTTCDIFVSVVNFETFALGCLYFVKEKG